jgi:putative heme iron utilization protein
MPETNALTETAAQDLAVLLQQAQSVHLATKNSEGKAEVSYAPVYIDKNRDLYVLISEIAEHTDNIRQTGHASAMLIEDESAAKHIFARQRATFDCQASALERDSDEWVTAAKGFRAHFEKYRLGDFVEGLYNMADFHLIRLRPIHGRLVTGFGRAFTLKGEGMGVIEHFRGATGKGHRKLSRSA